MVCTLHGTSGQDCLCLEAVPAPFPLVSVAWFFIKAHLGNDRKWVVLTIPHLIGGFQTWVYHGLPSGNLT